MQRRKRRPTKHHVSGLFGNHNRRRVGVGSNYSRHDGCIRDPQPLDATHLEVAVDHRFGVTAHLAGAGLMMGALDACPYPMVDRLVIQSSGTGGDLLVGEWSERLLAYDLPRLTYARA